MKQIEVVAAIIRKAVIEQGQSDARINSAEREQARHTAWVWRLEGLVGISWRKDGAWGNARGGAEAGDSRGTINGDQRG